MIRSRAALALLLLASCNDTEVTIGGLQEVMILPALPNPNLDILFVIDDSPSMLEEQQALVASFPHMMDQLASLEGGLPSVHIGVVTTDMGTSAADGANGPSVGSGAGSCSGRGKAGELRRDMLPELGTAAYIEDLANPDGSRTRNYTGNLRDVFAQLAHVGADGCGFEQPLLAMKTALQNPANAGFLRPGANLAVVILADEDDCSLTTPQLLSSDPNQLGALQSFRCTRFGVTCDQGGETPDAMNMVGVKTGCHANESSAYVDDVTPYVDFLRTLKGDPNAVMVSVIVGDPTMIATEVRLPPGGGTPLPSLAHSCAYDNQGVGQTADPGLRLAEVANSLPARGDVTSICNADLALPMLTIGSTARQLMGDPCVDVPLVDTSMATGPQPRCEVVDGPPGAETMIPECAENPTGTCWSLVLDTAYCGGVADSLRLQVTRPTLPTSQVYAHLRCLTR